MAWFYYLWEWFYVGCAWLPYCPCVALYVSLPVLWSTPLLLSQLDKVLSMWKIHPANLAATDHWTTHSPVLPHNPVCLQHLYRSVIFLWTIMCQRERRPCYWIVLELLARPLNRLWLEKWYGYDAWDSGPQWSNWSICVGRPAQVPQPDNKNPIALSHFAIL